MMIRRLLLRTLVGGIGLIALGVLFLWFLVRASLPALDGDTVSEVLQSEVTIERDANGIPTLRARNRTDLAFATGYVHAQDRFVQMDLMRRDAAGELAALVGPAAVEMDKRRRFHQFRALAREVIAQQSADDLALLQHYVDGVNAGLASLQSRPPEYWLLGAEPAAWQLEDTLLVVYAMYLQLNDARAEKDVQRGYAFTALPADVYHWLYPTHTRWDAPILSEPFDVRTAPGPDVLRLTSADVTTAPNLEQSLPPMNGSNNWAVSGALTESGGALVANDMHLGHSVPNVWYRIRLITEGDVARDISGVSLPGTSFLIAGSNGKIAWGYTNSYGDWSDAVLVKPGAAANTYQTEQGDQPIESVTEIIDVAGGEPVEYTIQKTRWGPINDQLRFAGQQVAVSWTAHHATATNLEIQHLETAATVEQAIAIGNRMGMPPQNLVVGDASGNIGWTIAGQIPLRTDYDPRIPADWSTQDGWQGWLPAADYPRVVNPTNHRLWTANARVVDGEALQHIGDGGYDLGARATQIRDVLLASEQFSPQDMLELQRDSRALFLTPWRDLLLDVLSLPNAPPELMVYRELVASWTPAAVPESVGYRLVRAFRLQTRASLFAHLTAGVKEQHGSSSNALMSERFEVALWELVSTRPAHLLPEGYSTWNEFLIEMVSVVDRTYQERYPGTLADREWGELNTVRIRHPFSSQLPFLSRWLDMAPVPLPGDENLPLAQGRSFGASERFSVTPGDEANGLMQMPAGQSGHPLSPFYRRGHQDWVEGRPAPFLPGAAKHTLTLRPRQP